MKLFLAHSCTLHAEALALADELRAAGCEIVMPTNPDGLTEQQIIQKNGALIGLCDGAVAEWDGVSDGCYGDVCMAIALGKPVWVNTIIGVYPGMTCIAGGQPHMPKAWALWCELPNLERLLEQLRVECGKTPAATQGGE